MKEFIKLNIFCIYMYFKGRKNGYGGRHGTHAILCIDTSGSMREGNAWSQVKQFYNDYLDGIFISLLNNVVYVEFRLIKISSHINTH
jgi:hypothetical protein